MSSPFPQREFPPRPSQARLSPSRELWPPSPPPLPSLWISRIARPEAAIAHYRIALRLRTDDAACCYNLARLLEDTGHPLQAADHYQQAIAMQPDFSAAHTNLAILLLTFGQTQEAIEHFETALRIDEDLAGYMNLVMIYSQLNRAAELIPVAEKALDLARSQGETSLAKELETILAYFRRQRFTP
jgi:tetratricopeptide (TPR) repeat protein